MICSSGVSQHDLDRESRVSHSSQPFPICLIIEMFDFEPTHNCSFSSKSNAVTRSEGKPSFFVKFLNELPSKQDKPLLVANQIFPSLPTAEDQTVLFGSPSWLVLNDRSWLLDHRLSGGNEQQGELEEWEPRADAQPSCHHPVLSAHRLLTPV